MNTFPGLKDPLIALSLLAIEPGLQGVLIGGPPGTGKTTIARVAKSLFPKDSPFVNVPLGCSMERLVGGIDLERSYKSGKSVASSGLLAEAHDGILYVDEINLLAPELTTVLLHALLEGQVRLEREGISKIFPAKFSLIGTFNPEEGEISEALTSRVAFTVWTQTLNHLSWRVFLANQAGQNMNMPPDIIHRVQKARAIIPQVGIQAGQVEELCRNATQMGVEGNRMEIFAARCAKANTALHHRVSVTQQDIDLATRLVYFGRMGVMSMPGDDELDTDYLSERSSRKKSVSSKMSEQTGSDSKGSQKKQGKSIHPLEEGPGDEKKAPKAKDLSGLEPKKIKEITLPSFPGKTKSVRKSGKHLSSLNLRRGRHVRSVPGSPGMGRLDLSATLKSAALSSSSKKSYDENSPGFEIKKENYHLKQFRRRSGLLFIFAIDGSGSMVFNHFQAAKGAALSLLEKAYVFRDQVAIIYFRHKDAKLLLPPGSSISRASRALKRIPAGGKTPLGAALLKTLQVAKQANSKREVAGTVLVLFTDGRANQPLKPIPGHPDPESLAIKELKPICKALRDNLAACVLFDTRRSPVANLTGQELANWLDAHYIYLPKTDAKQIAGMVQREVTDLRK